MNTATENTIIEVAAAPRSGENVVDVAKTPRKTTKPKTVAKKSHATDRLQPLADGESVSTTTLVLDDNTVETTYGFKLSASATDRYSKTTKLDFTNVSRAELLTLATSNVRITVQGRLRAMGEAGLQHNAFSVVDVKSDIVDAAKQTVDDLTKAARSMVRASGGKLSEASAMDILRREIK